MTTIIYVNEKIYNNPDLLGYMQKKLAEKEGKFTLVASNPEEFYKKYPDKAPNYPISASIVWSLDETDEIGDILFILYWTLIAEGIDILRVVLKKDA